MAHGADTEVQLKMIKIRAKSAKCWFCLKMTNFWWFLTIFDSFGAARSDLWAPGTSPPGRVEMWKGPENVKKQWKNVKNGQFWNCRMSLFRPNLSAVSRDMQKWPKWPFWGFLKKWPKNDKKWTRVSSSGKSKNQKVLVCSKNSIFKKGVHRPIEAIDLTETRKIAKNTQKCHFLTPLKKVTKSWWQKMCHPHYTRV